MLNTNDLVCVLDLHKKLPASEQAHTKALAESILSVLVGGPTGHGLAGQLTLEEYEMCRTGRKISAIREYRSRTGVTLKTAKEIVEANYDFPRV